MDSVVVEAMALGEDADVKAAADDRNRLANRLAAGLDAGAIRIESGRRILTIDPKFASQVPLFIFDRKA